MDNTAYSTHLLRSNDPTTLPDYMQRLKKTKLVTISGIPEYKRHHRAKSTSSSPMDSEETSAPPVKRRRGRPPKKNGGRSKRGRRPKQEKSIEEQLLVYQKQRLTESAFPNYDKSLTSMKRYVINMGSATRRYIGDGTEVHHGISDVIDDRIEQNWMRNATEVCRTLQAYREVYQMLTSTKKEKTIRERRHAREMKRAERERKERESSTEATWRPHAIHRPRTRGDYDDDGDDNNEDDEDDDEDDDDELVYEDQLDDNTRRRMRRQLSMDKTSGSESDDEEGENEEDAPVGASVSMSVSSDITEKDSDYQAGSSREPSADVY